jgi:hypothetical protein
VKKEMRLAATTFKGYSPQKTMWGMEFKHHLQMVVVQKAFN